MGPAARCSTFPMDRRGEHRRCAPRIRPASTVSHSDRAATPSASPTATPEGATPGRLRFLAGWSSSRAPARLRRSAAQSPSAAAFSPNGRYLAMAFDDGNGGSRIVTSQSNGSQRDKLIDSPTPVTSLTWASNDRIIYTDGTTIHSVDLSHATVLAVHAPAGVRHDHRARPRRRVCVRLAGRRHGRLAAQYQHRAEQVLRVRRPMSPSAATANRRLGRQPSQPARLFTEAVGQNAPVDGPAAGCYRQPERCRPRPERQRDRLHQHRTRPASPSSSWRSCRVARRSRSRPSRTHHSSRCLRMAPTRVCLHHGAGGANVEQACGAGRYQDLVGGADSLTAPTTTLQHFVQAQVGQNGQPDVATLTAAQHATVNAAANTPQNLSRAYVISTYVQSQGSLRGKHRADRRSGCRGIRRRGLPARPCCSRRNRPPVRCHLSVHDRDCTTSSAGPHVVQVSIEHCGRCHYARGDV